MWKTWEEIKNFSIKIHSGNRENHSIEVFFCFIPISQSIAEIQGFKASIYDSAKIINELARPSDLHFFQESRLLLVYSLRWVSETRCEREGKNEDSKRFKITDSFTRRYLENRKSYRDEWKSVLKGKVPRFWRASIRR